MADELEAVASALADRGWFVGRDLLDDAIVRGLADEAWSLWEGGGFRQAAVGRGVDRRVLQGVRGDWLHWLDPVAPAEVERPLFDWMEELRRTCNRSLFLGLHELELQYAVYPPGQRYERHVDRHVGEASRLVTVLLYLNADWQAADGGQLRLYAEPDAATPAVDVLPEWNTFVCFLSDRIPHEVMPPGRPRLSLGGWFRARR